MSSEITIRPAGEGDLAGVHDLLMTTWHDTYDVLIGADKVSEITARWHAVDILRRELADQTNHFLVAEVDGRLAGHAMARLSADGEGLLRRLYVAPQAQGCGIGRALLQAVQTRLGCATPLVLEVEQQNRKAIDFYTRHGFTETGRTDQCGGDSNVPAIILRREPIKI